MLDDAEFPGFCADWPAPVWVHTWSTERALDVGGQGAGLSDAARANRSRIGARLGVRILWLDQVHGNRVNIEDCNGDADAVVSRSGGVACAIRTADCLPVLFCHRQARVVAAAHAGWKGLVEGILEATVETMKVDPAGVLAWLGPAIGPTAFEVGPEVRDRFLTRDVRDAVAFQPGLGDRWLADIYQLARLRLARAGVSVVYGGGLCTVTDARRFYSWRRDGSGAGRMAHLIWIGEE